MTASRAPKFIGAKLGLVSALALGSLPLVCTEALATPAGTVSDTLQVGSATFPLLEGGTESVTSPSQTICNSFEANCPIPNFLSRTILLLDPVTNSISDIVTATITCQEGCEVTQFLQVTLTSDGETPLLPPSGGPFPTLIETGLPQDLSSHNPNQPNFTDLFGYSSPSPIPTILVTSDVEPVPEPASLALLGSGLAGLALTRRRRRKA